MGIMFTGQNHQCFNRLLCNFKVRKQIAAENLCFYEIVLIMVDGTLAKVSRNHEANAEVLLPHKVAKTESRWCEVGLCSRILSTLKGTMRLSVGEQEREREERREAASLPAMDRDWWRWALSSHPLTYHRAIHHLRLFFTHFICNIFRDFYSLRRRKA